MDTNVPAEHDLSLASNESELYRQLIEQFYEGSVARYGVDSVQARILSSRLTADLLRQR
jgi:hypothetical protein